MKALLMLSLGAVIGIGCGSDSKGGAGTGGAGGAGAGGAGAGGAGAGGAGAGGAGAGGAGAGGAGAGGAGAGGAGAGGAGAGGRGMGTGTVTLKVDGQAVPFDEPLTVIPTDVGTSRLRLSIRQGPMTPSAGHASLNVGLGTAATTGFPATFMQHNNCGVPNGSTAIPITGQGTISLAGTAGTKTYFVLSNQIMTTRCELDGVNGHILLNVDGKARAMGAPTSDPQITFELRVDVVPPPVGSGGSGG